MNIIFDFTCDSCGHTFERLVDKDCRTDTCPECGGVGNRIISPVRCSLDPVSGDFPGATVKFERQHERLGYKGD